MIKKTFKKHHADIYTALVTVGLSAFGVQPTIAAGLYHVGFVIPGMVATVLVARWVGRQQAKE